ncbi:type III polyketide synthase [Rhizobacter sp. Root1221]|uniref:type III polyketide synthase n=1 Tax=Rhizobacter sp. Root1221 TaxID=1736433 RepID=UPI0009EB61C9|nr:3-oxoacyl-[acyl-carrier-protein] synthase III C-terminal domain-containing protein [Rhizobacter sp. Root1221]
MTIRIASVESAFPGCHIAKRELIEYVKQRHQPFSTPSELARLEKLHRGVAVEGRHFALALDAYRLLRDAQSKHSALTSIATDLGRNVVARALDATGLAPTEVDHVILASSSVISCPTVDVRIISDLEMRSDVIRTPLLGLGCAGGLMGISRAADYLRAYPGGVVVFCAIELISLFLRWEDCSINAQSNIGLFGDAGAAAVLVGPNHPLARNEQMLGPSILASRSVLLRNTHTLVRVDSLSEGDHPTMAHDISDFIGAHVRREAEAFLASHRLRLSDIGSWICHPGGPKTVAKMVEALDLPAATADLMHSTLQSCGNVSSANLLVLLQTIMNKQRPAPGTHGLAVNYGPGFNFEFVLVRW